MIGYEARDVLRILKALMISSRSRVSEYVWKCYDNFNAMCRTLKFDLHDGTGSLYYIILQNAVLP